MSEETDSCCSTMPATSALHIAETGYSLRPLPRIAPRAWMICVSGRASSTSRRRLRSDSLFPGKRQISLCRHGFVPPSGDGFCSENIITRDDIKSSNISRLLVSPVSFLTEISNCWGFGVKFLASGENQPVFRAGVFIEILG